MILRIRVVLASALLLLQTAIVMGEATVCGCEISGDKIIFKGAAEVIDGDTLWLGIHRIRLHGVDAIEPKQTCRISGQIVACAEQSRRFLEKFAIDPKFECRVHRDKKGRPWIRYNRYVATCFVGDTNVNDAMVAAGHALADRTSFGDDYRELEKQARKKGVGIHAANYTKPWEFRRGQRGTSLSSDECDCDEEP